jgi:hypothetical protein
MISIHPQLNLPLLFAVNHQLTCSIVFPRASTHAGLRNIHLPHRIIRNFEGLSIIPNTTTQPVKVATSSVIMSFDVSETRGGDLCWNARMLSSNENECDLFLMDNFTLKPIMYVKLRVVAPVQNQGYTLSISARLFDLYTLLGFWCMLTKLKFTTPNPSAWTTRHAAPLKGSTLKRDMTIHRKYMKMALTAEYMDSKGEKKMN